MRIIKLCAVLQQSYVTKHICSQIIRAGTSIGANYEEARGAESKADFVHKVNISVKEALETLYWLKILKQSELIKPEKLNDIIIEANEICSILIASSRTVKYGKKN